MADVIRLVRSTRQRAVITRYGLPLVAIVPIEDLERLTQAIRAPSAEPEQKTRKRAAAVKRDNKRAAKR